jgi:hypothetical protein
LWVKVHPKENPDVEKLDGVENGIKFSMQPVEFEFFSIRDFFRGEILHVLANSRYPDTAVPTFTSTILSIVQFLKWGHQIQYHTIIYTILNIPQFLYREVSILSYPFFK